MFLSKKRFAPTEIFTLGFRVKFKRNDHVFEEVHVGASELFEKGKEKDQLSVFRRSDGTLLQDIKDSFLFFMFLLCEATEHLQNLPILKVTPSPVWAKSDNARFLEK